METEPDLLPFNPSSPSWIRALIQDYVTAKILCAFTSEWGSGTLKSMDPLHIKMSRATFDTWTPQVGWNNRDELYETKTNL